MSRPLLPLLLCAAVLCDCPGVRSSSIGLHLPKTGHHHGHTSIKVSAVARKSLDDSHEKESTPVVSSESLCIGKTTVLSIKDSVASKTGSMKGWMTPDDWGEELRKIDASQHPVVRVGVDGFPCAKHGCCQHIMSIRLGGSDWYVLQHVINEYADFLAKLLPWKPETILEGGGNIGVATSLLAFMYPDAKIIAMEPEPENCILLKENTQVFKNVEVSCLGLWDREGAAVQLVLAGDGKPWAWRLEEVPVGAPGALQSTSVPALLQKHNLTSFDMLKLDIEGAEFSVFGEGADTTWLEKTQVVFMELHSGYGDAEAVRQLAASNGFHRAISGEYDVFARQGLN